MVPVPCLSSPQPRASGCFQGRVGLTSQLPARGKEDAGHLLSWPACLPSQTTDGPQLYGCSSPSTSIFPTCPRPGLQGQPSHLPAHFEGAAVRLPRAWQNARLWSIGPLAFPRSAASPPFICLLFWVPDPWLRGGQDTQPGVLPHEGSAPGRG